LKEIKDGGLKDIKKKVKCKTKQKKG